MTKSYSDPRRADDPHALPDVEIWYAKNGVFLDRGYSDERSEPGWYWWPCFPGCMPDGDPTGPFESYDAALADAQDGCGDE